MKHSDTTYAIIFAMVFIFFISFVIFANSLYGYIKVSNESDPPYRSSVLLSVTIVNAICLALTIAAGVIIILI
jgi:ascorbate-specific PTS system EIIC-type component UlaA